MVLLPTALEVLWFQLLECVVAAVLYPITVGVADVATMVGEVTLQVAAWAVPL